MSREDIPMTPGIRVLKAAKAEFEAHRYTYEEHGGTEQASRELGVEEHRVIKTIVLKLERDPIIVLMHGDMEISLKALARQLGVKSVEQCTVAEAQKYSGYFCGGISPFGFRKQGIKIYAQKTIFDLDWIIINGGARGLFVRIQPELLKSIVHAEEVDVAC